MKTICFALLLVGGHLICLQINSSAAVLALSPSLCPLHLPSIPLFLMGAFAISIKMPYIMARKLPLRTSNAIKIKCSAPFLNQSKS